MAAKKSAFSEASDAIVRAFHQLERAVMGTAPAKAAEAKPAKKKARKTVKKKARKTAKKKARK